MLPPRRGQSGYADTHSRDAWTNVTVARLKRHLEAASLASLRLFRINSERCSRPSEYAVAVGGTREGSTGPGGSMVGLTVLCRVGHAAGSEDLAWCAPVALERQDCHGYAFCCEMGDVTKR